MVYKHVDMSNKGQVVFIIFLFLALILLSAGVGALAARAVTFGSIFCIIGAVVLVADIVGLLLVRKSRPKLAP